MRDLSRTILDTLDQHRQIAPISDRHADFDLAEAYRIADEVMQARRARGEAVRGWKIGFTNRTIWDEYGVRAPIWGPMYSTGITSSSADSATDLAVDGFVEPRIEPEIVFRMARRPEPTMDDAELIACIEAVGHGFEIVQSIFPGWKFAAADTVAAGALHGAFVHGPLVAIGPQERDGWIERLQGLSVELLRDGSVIDRGVAANVLDGPLAALRHFIAGLETQPMSRGVEPGDLVTTGTLTRAFPVAAGERWTTRIAGAPLPGPAIAFR